MSEIEHNRCHVCNYLLMKGDCMTIFFNECSMQHSLIKIRPGVRKRNIKIGGAIFNYRLMQQRLFFNVLKRRKLQVFKCHYYIVNFKIKFYFTHCRSTTTKLNANPASPTTRYASGSL